MHTATTGIRNPIATVKIKHANHYTVDQWGWIDKNAFDAFNDFVDE